MIDKTFGILISCVFMLMFLVYVFTDLTPSVAGDPADANRPSLKKEVTENMWDVVPQ